MKRILILFIFTVYFFIPNKIEAQCYSILQYNSTQTPTTSWQIVQNHLIGAYSKYNVVQGEEYTWSYCSANGGNPNGYNLTMTLRDINTSPGTTLAYSDDECGNRPEITWTATYTGIAYIVVMQYPCIPNVFVGTNLAFRKTASPDLAYSGSGSSLSINGMTANITFPVKNIGTGTSGASTLKYYLSTDTNITIGDYEIGSDYVSPLSTGATSTESITVNVTTVSPNIPAGTYYIGVLIDANGAVTESNETNNNTYWSNPQITIPPSLSVNLPSQNISSSGGNVSFIVSSNISWTVSNNQSWANISSPSGSGNGSFTVFCQPNTSTTSRTATITVSGTGGTQIVTITQAGVTAPFTWTPTNQSGIFRGQAQVSGIAATANDWVAAFDQNGNIAGAAQIIMNNGIAYINLPIYGDDPTTPSFDEGMNIGEYFTIQLYDASENVYKDYPISALKFQFTQWINTNGTPMPTYNSANDIYDFVDIIIDTIILNAGWNLISTDVIPTDTTIAGIFTDVINDGNLIYVTGYDNGSKFYDPNGLSFFNTLNGFTRRRGYWVKVNVTDTLIVYGLPIVHPPKPSLVSGWNLIAYIPQVSTTPANYFSNLIDSSNLIYVTGYDNGSKFYDPNGLSFFNTLTSLDNGDGYWVKVNTNASAYKGSGINPTNVYDFINGVSNLSDYEGQEVIVKTEEGVECGRLLILEEGYLMTNSIYGDDLLTTEVDGIAIGDKLLFEFKGETLDENIVFEGNMQLHQLNLNFNALTATLPNVDIQKVAFNCYPNPFTSTLSVSYDLKQKGNVTIKIHNTLGQMVRVLEQGIQLKGQQTLTWTAEKETSGIYFISLEIDGQVIENQKVILQK